MSVSLLDSCQTQQTAPTRVELLDTYRAARAVEAALQIGVSYQDFSQLLLAFSKGLLLLQDRVSVGDVDPNTAAIAKDYAELLTIYKDSAAVWTAEIQKRDWDEQLPVIANKYGVATAVSKRPGSPIPYVGYEAIRQATWRRASELQVRLTGQVLGRTLMPVPAK